MENIEEVELKKKIPYFTDLNIDIKIYIIDIIYRYKILVKRIYVYIFIYIDK